MMEMHNVVSSRTVHTVSLTTDLCVVGGGLSGVGAAITAARLGTNVVLIQDRPVLGGNSSSEVRLWVLGATSHMGNNNRYAREGGVIDEILTENVYRNPEGNPVIFDTIVLEWVTREPNIRLLLNTAVYQITKHDDRTVASVSAYNSQNETRYEVSAALFCDSSGDGVVAFQAGASFRFGAEGADEFGEDLALDPEEYGERLGHSIFFYTKDTGRPVEFHAPAFALADAEKHIPRFRNLSVSDNGCRFWWIEYGGRLDTVRDTERIKWELWRVIYGVWDHIKNSEQFPEADTLTLEWVGMVPGKRESRRFMGPYILRQNDVIEQTLFPDGVAHGGWSIDHHPADGVYSSHAGSRHVHAPGVYSIPLRCLYSRDIDNLFFAGRIISVSHVAFGTTRVMGTGAACGQAVGVAATTALRHSTVPGAFEDRDVREIRETLARMGQYMPGYRFHDSLDLAHSADVSASSEFDANEMEGDLTLTLDREFAALFPGSEGKIGEIEISYLASAPRTASFELWTSSTTMNFTPDVKLGKVDVNVEETDVVKVLRLGFQVALEEKRFLFLKLPVDPRIKLLCANTRVSGRLLLTCRDRTGYEWGYGGFDLYPPVRRPDGWPLIIRCLRPIRSHAVSELKNGLLRPVGGVNGWAPSVNDEAPSVRLTWQRTQTIAEVQIVFDNDLDHAMESVLMGHPERAMAHCVRSFEIADQDGRVLHRTTDNHHGLVRVILAEPIQIRSLELRLGATWGEAVPTVFDFRVYEQVTQYARRGR